LRWFLGIAIPVIALIAAISEEEEARVLGEQDDLFFSMLSETGYQRWCFLFSG